MSTPNLTPAELKVLALAWHCFTEMPKVDYAKLAQVGGYKTTASANAVYLSARKKLLSGVPAAGGEGSDGISATPRTPKGGGKKRAAGEEDGTPVTGAKKKRRTKAEMAAAAAAAAAAGGDEDDEEGLGAVKEEVKGDEDGDDVAKVLEGAADAIAEAGAEGEAKIKGEQDDE